MSFPQWQFRHYESLLKKAEVENNGHTLQLSPSKKEKKLPSVSGNNKKVECCSSIKFIVH